MPKKLPEDLYSKPIQESAIMHLQKFRDGEVSKTDALEQAMKDIRGRFTSALDAIAARITGDVATEQLPKKIESGRKFWHPAGGEEEKK